MSTAKKEEDEVSAKHRVRMHNVYHARECCRCARIKITKHETLNKHRWALRELLFASSSRQPLCRRALFTSFVYSPLINCLSNRTQRAAKALRSLSLSALFPFEDFAFCLVGNSGVRSKFHFSAATPRSIIKSKTHSDLPIY